MIYSGELQGFVGLDVINHSQPWSMDTIELLRRVGEILCNSLERQRYQETLATEKERLSVTLQSIGDGVITTDVDGRVLLINRVGELLTGWQEADVVSPLVFLLVRYLSRREVTRDLFHLVWPQFSNEKARSSELFWCFGISPKRVSWKRS